MPRPVTALFEWAMIAATVGMLLFILLSPSGSFVRTPMDHTRQVIESRDDLGVMAVQASPASR